MSPSKGRPPIDDPKNKRMEFRVTETQKREIQEFMKKTGISLYELVRRGIDSFKE